MVDYYENVNAKNISITIMENTINPPVTTFFFLPLNF